MDLHLVHIEWTRSMHMQYGHEAQKFRTNMQHEHATWASIMEKQQEHAAGTYSILLKTLACPLVEWNGLWNRVSCRQSEEIARIRPFFSFAIDTFAFFALFLFALRRSFCFALTSTGAHFWPILLCNPARIPCFRAIYIHNVKALQFRATEITGSQQKLGHNIPSSFLRQLL